MLPLASDADLKGAIVKGIRTIPGIDFVRSIDVLPEGADDRDVLEWCASENRILVSNDHNTMIGFAMDRIEAGLPMPGLIMTNLDKHSVGRAIDDIWSIVAIMSAEEVRNIGVLHLPY